MFMECYNLTAFTTDLPSLKRGYYMMSHCYALESFDSDVSSLDNAMGMFMDCSSLMHFNGNLSSLTNGYYMFHNCKLNTQSVQNIANSINDVTSLQNGGGPGDNVYKEIGIGINNYSPNSEENTAFNTMASKGWRVCVNGNDNVYYPEGGYYGTAASCCASGYYYGTAASYCASAATLDELGETGMFTPKPYWAKPIPSDEEHAEYVDSEGNFYNILGAQFIYGDDLSTYGMFINEEDAQAQMRLTKIGAEEIETA